MTAAWYEEPLHRAVQYFTVASGLMPCFAVACGNGSRSMQAFGGVIDEQQHPLQPDTLFDLASLTKMFTGMAVLRLREQHDLRLDDPAVHYLPDYPGLGDTSIDQLLGFEVLLQTPVRVDAQQSAADAEAVLRQVRAMPHTTTRYYSDMHALVLGKLLEAVSGVPLQSLLDALFFRPLGIRPTAAPSAEERGRCPSYDNEYRCLQGQIVHLRHDRGYPHDPKARLLGQNGKVLCGHAGLFATLGDLTRFAQAVLNGQVLSEASLRLMAENRTGHPLADGGYSQYLGRMAYVRHPLPYFSEVPQTMGDHAIAWSGFTGNHLSIDPERNLFTLALGNRVMSRLTQLIPAANQSRADYGLHEDGSGWFVLPDGQRIASTVDYVHRKDQHLHAAVAEAMQL